MRRNRRLPREGRFRISAFGSVIFVLASAMSALRTARNVTRSGLIATFCLGASRMIIIDRRRSRA